jgi:hypothetical protein
MFASVKTVSTRGFVSIYVARHCSSVYLASFSSRKPAANCKTRDQFQGPQYRHVVRNRHSGPAVG